VSTKEKEKSRLNSRRPYGIQGGREQEKKSGGFGKRGFTDRGAAEKKKPQLGLSGGRIRAEQRRRRDLIYTYTDRSPALGHFFESACLQGKAAKGTKEKNLRPEIWSFRRSKMGKSGKEREGGGKSNASSASESSSKESR